ncbi:MAG: hypothetical protein AAB500_02400 [Patescibacteria group bacterium]
MNDDADNRFLVFLLAFFLLVAGLFSAGNFKSNGIIRLEDIQAMQAERSLAGLALEAKAVSVYDFTANKKIYGGGDELPLAMASLAKSMTVTLALNVLGEDGAVRISKEAVSQSGDFGLTVGESWRAGELAKLTLIASANDGAYALAEAAGGNFLDKMNEKTRKIGMEHAVFLSVTGLDELEEGVPVLASGFASASDLNTLAYYALRSHPEVFTATTSEGAYGFQNTNPAAGKIPNLLFSKTGFTDLAGGNLSIIFKNRDEHIIAVTILGSSYEGRFSDMEKIVSVLYSE